MTNVVVTAGHISTSQGQRGASLAGYVGDKATRQRDVDGTAALDTAKALIWNGMGVHGLLHHPMPKEDLIAEVEVSLHEEEGTEFVDVNDPSLFLKNHLEARLPAEGRKAIGKA